MGSGQGALGFRQREVRVPGVNLRWVGLSCLWRVDWRHTPEDDHRAAPSERLTNRSLFTPRPLSLTWAPPAAIGWGPITWRMLAASRGNTSRQRSGADVNGEDNGERWNTKEGSLTPFWGLWIKSALRSTQPGLKLRLYSSWPILNLAFFLIIKRVRPSFDLMLDLFLTSCTLRSTDCRSNQGLYLMHKKLTSLLVFYRT